MSNNSKFNLDIKLTSHKIKAMLGELDKLNNDLLDDIEDVNKSEIISVNKLKLLYNTISEFPLIVENSLSEELREKLKR